MPCKFNACPQQRLLPAILLPTTHGKKYSVTTSKTFCAKRCRDSKEKHFAY